MSIYFFIIQLFKFYILGLTWAGSSPRLPIHDADLSFIEQMLLHDSPAHDVEDPQNNDSPEFSFGDYSDKTTLPTHDWNQGHYSMQLQPPLHVSLPPSNDGIVEEDKGKLQTPSVKAIKTTKYSGYEWQKEISPRDQNILYERVEEEWGIPTGKGNKNRMQQAHRCFQKAMTIEIAKKILSGNRQVTIQFAKDTINGEGARVRALTLFSDTSKRKKNWPDDDLKYDDRKLIMKNLRNYWKDTTRHITRDRLESHYDKGMASGLMSSDRSIFEPVANHLYSRTMAGRMTGGKRLRL